MNSPQNFFNFHEALDQKAIKFLFKKKIKKWKIGECNLDFFWGNTKLAILLYGDTHLPHTETSH